MKHFLHHAFRLFLVLSFFIFAPSFAQAVSLGVTPADLEFGEILNGISKQGTITLTRSEALEELLGVRVEFQDGAEALLSGETKIFFPPGVDTISYSLTIRAQSLPHGTYEAIVNFLPEVAETNGVSIQSGVSLRVRYIVSDAEFTAFEILDVSSVPTEEDEPIVIRYLVENTGNTLWRPDELTMAIYDERGKLLGKKSTPRDLIPFVSPGERNILYLEADLDVGAGSYDVLTEAHYGNRVIFSRHLPATISAKGSVVHQGRLLLLEAVEGTVTPGEPTKFVGTYVNEGEANHEAHMILEVYEGNTIIDIAESEKVRVEVGETVQFYESVQFPASGSYELVAYVIYGEKTTGTTSTSVTARVGIVERTINWLLVILVFALISFSGFLFLAHKKSRQKEWHAPILRKIISGDEFISGLAEAPDGVVVELFKNGDSIGTAQISKGEWRLRLAHGMGLQEGDRIRAEILKEGEEGELASKEISVVKK